MPSNKPKAVAYGGPDYDRLIASAEEAARKGEGARLLFRGGSDEEVRAALRAVADRTGFHVHQVNLAALVGEQATGTQANLREVFDTRPQDAILFFHNADDLLAAADRAPHDALTPADYLLRRMGAFEGLAILHVRTSGHARLAAAEGLDAEVRFGSGEAE